MRNYFPCLCSARRCTVRRQDDGLYHERKSHRGFYSADRLMEGLALEWLRATIAGLRGPGLAEPVSVYSMYLDTYPRWGGEFPRQNRRVPGSDPPTDGASSPPPHFASFWLSVRADCPAVVFRLYLGSFRLRRRRPGVREFVLSHPAYKFDSVVSPEVNYDLVIAIDEM